MVPANQSGRQPAGEQETVIPAREKEIHSHAKEVEDALMETISQQHHDIEHLERCL
jgi:hypothetical protein